ncbi:hypothetical protein HOD20_09775 [archaeon]|jgi:hypothetical protein|nr:hypothetical protein [Candidatus Woesearchaeota archaeon]MBT3464952.1 hypothetical protein [archaeon]MBT4352798.1 hypothetical protein [archaeon]MBT4647569.1 hypothetical protein [archaeon]MBT6821935.1 hypothetical protein [archaeon]
MAKKDKPILIELWEFLKVRKKWWLTPIIVMLLLVAFLIIFGSNTGVPVFIYPLF